MAQNLRHPSRWAVFLLLALLSLQVGARLNLCLMPDGDVHIKEHHSPCCDIAGEETTIAPLLADNHHLDSEAHLDISIEDGAAAHQQKPLQPPPFAITPLGEPIPLAQTASPLFPRSQSDLSPQLLPARSVAILRI